MVIGCFATITVQEGKHAEIEKVFLELTAQLRANKVPGTPVAAAPEIEVLATV